MSVDIVGAIIFLLGLVLYYAVKGKKAIFLFVSGVGAGIVIAVIWITTVLQMDGFLP